MERIKNHLKKIYIALVAGAMLITAGSCREETVITPATFSLLLTGQESKTWKLSAYRFIFDDPREPPFDITFLVPPCQLDDLFSFYRAGRVLEITEGETSCEEGSDDLILRTSWEIVNANASLFIGSSQFTLLKLTEDSLVYGVRDTLQYEIVPNTFEKVPGLFENTFLVAK